MYTLLLYFFRTVFLVFTILRALCSSSSGSLVRTYRRHPSEITDISGMIHDIFYHCCCCCHCSRSEDKAGAAVSSQKSFSTLANPLEVPKMAISLNKIDPAHKFITAVNDPDRSVSDTISAVTFVKKTTSTSRNRVPREIKTQISYAADWLRYTELDADGLLMISGHQARIMSGHVFDDFKIYGHKLLLEDFYIHGSQGHANIPVIFIDSKAIILITKTEAYCPEPEHEESASSESSLIREMTEDLLECIDSKAFHRMVDCIAILPFSVKILWLHSDESETPEANVDRMYFSRSHGDDDQVWVSWLHKNCSIDLIEPGSVAASDVERHKLFIVISKEDRFEFLIDIFNNPEGFFYKELLEEDELVITAIVHQVNS